MTGLISYFDLIAVGVFAISGALAAAEEKLDVLGFILFGTLTGVGGGTVRDLLLQSGP
ncbi:MAG: TRIC cation channel family protein, partial [Chromatocurvus sp.]